MTAELKCAWQARPGGRLTAPVVADGRVLLASVDTHTVHALDAASGDPLWQYTAGGRIDSPPTISQGLVCSAAPTAGSIACGPLTAGLTGGIGSPPRSGAW